MSISSQVIFCDDIRREESGKFLFVGTYTDDLAASSFPANFPMSAWIKVWGIKAGNYKVEFTIEFPGGKSVKMNGDLFVQSEDEATSFMMAGFPASIQKPGPIIARVKLDDEVLEIGRLRVVAQQQPQTPA